MKNKSIGLKILPVIIAVAVIICGYLYVDMNGNPLDASKIDKLADSYMQENYPDIWQNVYKSANAYFVKSDISYWDEESQQNIIIDGSWQVYYTDNNDEWSYMYLVYDRDCNLIYDGVADRYLKGAMIVEKLEQEYDTLIKNVFDEIYNNGMPTHTTSETSLLEQSGAQSWFKSEESIRNEWGQGYGTSHISPYTGPVLDINKEYTMEELASEYGVVHFRFNDGVYYHPGDGTSPDDEDYKLVINNLYIHCAEIRTRVLYDDIPFKEICVTHGLYEGVYFMSREQLLNIYLWQYIYDNYTIM